jgi:hypothetical protein
MTWSDPGCAVAGVFFEEMKRRRRALKRDREDLVGGTYPTHRLNFVSLFEVKADQQFTIKFGI